MTIPANTQGRVSFNTIPQLRNQANQIITVQCIEVFTDNSYAHSQVTNTIVGMPAAELPKAVLTLYVNGEESIKMIPLAKLQHISSDGAASTPFQWQVQWFDDLTNVNWDQSYVQFNAASSGTQYVIPFGITYLRFLEQPKI